MRSVGWVRIPSLLEGISASFRPSLSLSGIAPSLYAKSIKTLPTIQYRTMSNLEHTK
jgi:hypothetical protein